MIKESMELHEKRAKKQLYHRFLLGVSARISKGIEHFFYRLGVHISANVFKWSIGCFIVMLICLLGLIRFRQEKNPLKLWAPIDSSFAMDTNWLMSHFKEGLRIQTFILTGDNVLEQQALIKLNEITKQMISIQTPLEKISWTDVCMKIPTIAGYRVKRQSSFSEDDFFDDDVTLKINETLFEPAIHTNTELYCNIINSLPKACLMLNILDIWNFNSANIEKDSKEEIISKINTVKVSPTLGHPINFSELLGGVTLDERGRIIAATAIKTQLMVHVKWIDVDMDKSGNAAGTADWASPKVLIWESAYLEVAKKFSKELQTETNNNNSLALYYEASSSFGDLSGANLFKDIDKLIVGVALMFLYVLMILSKYNWVEWRFCLTSVGLFCVGSAFILAVGICSLLGIPYGPIHTSLPFLLLGLGVDDMFVFNAYWRQIHSDELILSKSLTERIGLTLGHAGSAITVTSFTDIVAFLISATTILPSLRSFCIYAAMGIFMTYLLQITFFIVCFTLDTRRIEQKRNGILPCIVHENFTPKLSDPSNTFSWKFIHALYSRLILTMPGKIIVIIITFTTMSISIVGTFQLKQGFDPVLLVPKGSYLEKFIITYNQKFSDQGFDAFVLMGDNIDYSSEFSKLISLTERLKNTSFIQNVEPWPIYFEKFVSTYYNADLRTTKISDDNFYHYLSKFLVSQNGGKYQRNFVFNETFICGKKAPRIIATTIEFKFIQLTSPSEWIPAMDDSKSLVSEAQIDGYITVWCKLFGPWTTDKLITQEIFRNLLLALICVMTTTAILIAEVQTCCWILLCVLLTLLNVCGFMYFWGQPIDMISSIGFQLAIGLSVDYAAHVAHAFLHTESREDDDKAPRTTRTLIAVRHIGAAVAYGAGSTLLAVSMLAFSTSYVFLAFFKIFLLVILFGLWHGLIVLPVVLSIIGPPSLRVTQRPQPMSATAIDDED